MSLLQKYLFTAFVLYFALINTAYGHGRLLDPPARSSAWRFDKKFPIEYTDNEMFCGGFQVQYEKNGGKCGICGEDFSAIKKWEKGGVNYRGDSVRIYQKGQKINVNVEITANHQGWFEFRICNTDGFATDATQDCLNKHLLKDENGVSRFNIPSNLYQFKKSLLLPSSLTCKHCVFQWKYNAGNNWGIDPVTKVGCLGCGNQEQFYGCADVSITNTKSSTQGNKIETKYSSVSSNSITTKKTSPTKSKKGSTKQCKNGNGLYADFKSKCKKYYNCNFVGTILESISYFECPDQTMFDNSLKSCNWKHLSKCA